MGQKQSQEELANTIEMMVIGHADMGIHAMVLGDIKPDYVDLVEALGGQVITIGHGRGGINPLDAGNVGGAVEAMAGHPDERAALLKAAHERKKNMVLSLMHIMRHQPPTNREETILDEAITILEARGGSPALADLLQVVREAPAALRDVALDRGDDDRYRAVTEELEVTLQALLRGRMGGIFAARATAPMRMDRSVVFDVHSLIHEHDDIQAAVLLACWSYGFATVEVAQANKSSNETSSSGSLSAALSDAGAVIVVSVVKSSAAHRRSEERRVGKECRSRWSPYH